MKQTERFTALDGLRGIAIIVVMLSHMDPSAIFDALPPFYAAAFDLFFGNGKWGLSWLFLMSGFLMAYLYPQPTDSFLPKRYARIFPLFVTMSFVMWVFWMFPQMQVLFRVALILACAGVTNILWRIVQQVNNPKLNKALFYGFIMLQIAMVVWYGLIIMRQPPIWFQNLPYGLYELTIFLVNATLTLPLGNYIPQLDGVYWSLTAEIFFYILYPVLFAPIARRVKLLPLYGKILTLIICFFLFGGLHIFAKETNGFAILQPDYFFYFTMGMAVAYFAKHKGKKKPPALVSIFGHPILLAALFIFHYISLHNLNGVILYYARMLWALPFALTLYALVDNNNKYASLFRTPGMLFLGTISYSMYLSHTAVIDTVKQLISHDHWATTLIAIGLASGGTILLSWVLYYLLEYPYFAHKKKLIAPQAGTLSYRFVYIPVVTTLLFFMGIFFVYQSNFNFLSTVYTYDKDVIVSPPKPTANQFSLQQHDIIELVFSPPEDRMGILALQFVYREDKTKPKDLNNQTMLMVRMKEEGTQEWYAQSQYSPEQVGDSDMLPFGIPLVKDSMGKTYRIVLSLTNRDTRKNLLFLTQPYVLRSVHQINKKAYLRNPSKIIHLFGNKLSAVTQNAKAQHVAAHILPALVGCWVLLWYGRKTHSHTQKGTSKGSPR